MPRAPRRAAHQARQNEVTATPTRNALTAEIPPFMLETPPHAPFLTTPLPPSNNPATTTAPDTNAPHRQQARNQQTTPTATGNVNANTQNDFPEQTHAPQPLVPTSEDGQGEGESLLESAHPDVEDAKQLRGLRDISSLATWTLSSAKPGCALPQLRNPSASYFWQSDGPQPHTLTLHFFKLVAIVKMRIYLDFELDESYTPTKMKFYAGMSEGGLVEFGQWEVTETVDPESGETQSSIEGVRGWIDVPLKGVGGRETRYHGNPDLLDDQEEPTLYPLRTDSSDTVGGDVLKAMVVQVRICENHQNGKDTHVRGFQVFARDYTNHGEVRATKKAKSSKKHQPSEADDEVESKVVGLQPADWMGEPEIR